MVQRVKKRDNSSQKFSPTKLNKWAEWACAGTSANWSNLCMQAVQKLPDEVTSSMLQKTLIETAIELISENYDYDKVAAKLLLADLRKEVFGEYTPPPLSIYAEYMHKMGYWDDLLSFYTEQEIHILEQAIDHSRDELFTCGGLKQAIAKYLKKDMGKLLETPQFMYMGMAMALRTDEDYAKNWPIEDIIGIYDEFSLQRVNVPTPPLVGLRSGDRGFASCCLIEAGDSIDSLDAAASAVFKMVANRAGIGYNAITRSIGEGVRNGSFSHTGKLPFYRHIDRATKALTQQCYSEDTEILTDKGWKLFSDLTDQDLVLQVLDSNVGEWVKPTNIFSYEYTGEMHQYGCSRNMLFDILVTPNHRMSYRGNYTNNLGSDDGYVLKRTDSTYTQGNKYKEEESNTHIPTRSKIYDLSVSSIVGGEDILTAYERILIAYAADGRTTPVSTNKYEFKFKKERKIERLQQLLEEAGLAYKVYDKRADGCVSFIVTFDTPPSKNLVDWVNIAEFSSKKAEEFLREMALWDGTLSVDTSKDAIVVFNTNKSDMDLASALASICGSTSHLTKRVKGPKDILDQWQVYITFNKGYTTGRSIAKSTTEYSGEVYCVEVPSGRVLVRRNGMPLVCGNSRGGSATVHYTFIDPELEVLLNLKSQRSAEDVKIEFMDYSLVYHPYLLELYIKDRPLKLISLIKHPEVYEALYSSNYDDFVLAYEKAEAEKEISTRDMLHTFMTRRVETGRNYWVNALEVNRHTTFNERIHMSNLCQEITQPTKPYRNILDLYEPSSDTGGEISLCNLGGIVFGRVDNYERTCYLLLKFIDTIIEIQHLPFPNLEYTSKARRNVAVGIINLANFLASNGLSYEGEEARNLVHKECEKMSFYLHKASNRLAKEIGACPWYRKTKYKEGVLPIDTYNKNVDSLESVGLTLDWDSLRKDIANYGMRNSTLTACMPGESSSVLLGATNGIEPIRDILVYKKSPAGVTHTLAPGVDDFSTLVSYVNAYDIDREEYIKMVAIITKWMTQSISFNQYYNYKDFDNEIIPMSVLIKDFFLCNKYGIKTAYYHNSGGNNAESAGESCAGGGCSL